MNPYVYLNGQTNTAINFDNITELSGATEVTIVQRLKLAELVSSTRDLSRKDNNFAIQVTANDKLFYYVNTGTWTKADGVIPIAPDKTVEVAMTYDGAKIRGYINGVFDAETSKTGALSTNSNALYIGGYNDSVRTKQSADKYKIWTSVLTADEIHNEFLGIPQSTGTLVLDADFENLVNGEISDRAGNYTGALEGDAEYVYPQRLPVAPYIHVDGVVRGTDIQFDPADILALGQGQIHLKVRPYQNKQTTTEFIFLHAITNSRIWIFIDAEVYKIRFADGGNVTTSVLANYGGVDTLSFFYDGADYEFYVNGNLAASGTEAALQSFDSIVQISRDDSSNSSIADVFDIAFSDQVGGREDHMAFLRGEDMTGLTFRADMRGYGTTINSLDGDVTGTVTNGDKAKVWNYQHRLPVAPYLRFNGVVEDYVQYSEDVINESAGAYFIKLRWPQLTTTAYLCNDDGSTDTLRIVLRQDNELRVFVGDSGSKTTTLFGEQGKVQYVGLAWNNGDIDVYLNDQIDTFAAAYSSFVFDGTFLVSNDSISTSMNADVFEYTTVGQAVTQDDFIRWWRDGVLPSGITMQADMVGYGSTVPDKSGNGNDGTIVNAQWI